MQTYQITFITLDGNTQDVYIDARSTTNAEMEFSRQYEYDEILSCECVSEENESNYELPSFEENEILEEISAPSNESENAAKTEKVCKTETYRHYLDMLCTPPNNKKGTIISISVPYSIWQLPINKENVAIIKWDNFNKNTINRVIANFPDKEIYIDLVDLPNYIIDNIFGFGREREKIMELLNYIREINVTVNLVFCRVSRPDGFMLFPNKRCVEDFDIAKHYNCLTKEFEIQKDIYKKK